MSPIQAFFIRRAGAVSIVAAAVPVSARNDGTSNSWRPSAAEWAAQGDAYDMVVEYTTPALQRPVLASLKNSLSLWLQYRDAVAKACRIKKP